MYAKPNLKLFAFLSFLALQVLCLSNCTGNNSQKVRQSISQTNDSIGYWLKKSNEISDTEYRNRLRKAYDWAIGEKDDSLRSHYFSRISYAYLQLNDSLDFRKTNKTTIALAKKIKDTATHAAAHWDLAAFFRRYAVQDSAYYHYAEAQKLYAESNNDFYAGRMLYNMGKVQADVKDFTGSEINLIRAIELLKPLDKNEQLYRCYNVLGIVSKGLKEYGNAIDYYQKALQYANEVGLTPSRFSTIQNNIGVVYQEKGEHAKAVAIFNEVLNRDNLSLSPEDYARTLDNLAYNQFKAGINEEGVQEKLKRALQIRDSIQDITGVAGSYFSLAEFYLHQNDSTKALETALKARNFAEESSNNERLLQAFELLARLDPKNAVIHAESYIKLNDSLQQDERKARNKFARIRFETNETIEQNRLLAQQKQLWVGIAVALLLMALAAFLFIDQRVKNQKLRFQREQQASNEKIFNLLLEQKQKVEEGKKIAQKRISEELHDGVQGRIQGVRMLLTGLNKRNTPEAIEERSEAIKELQDIQEEVRVISHELSHAAYQKIHNFINTIEELLRDVQTSAQLQYTFEYDENFDWDMLNSDIKVNLYRVIQESLQNCVKHAKAGNVKVRFEIENDQMLNVSIADDGKGFEIRKGKKGIGLRNIASRIEKIGGDWDIGSSIGKGTTVSFSIPILSSKAGEDAINEKEFQEA
ncbi:tetratricopeptide repeat protein [Flavobacteriaceae bacterium TP-CH-4]|uniref:Oxygen sensor histidine kinase NreB n=1 Tax=Pelagihabitans pacificus TaxID=2696054 RepID=A0A967AU78_9FLAO|nr:sensor histidine kinase [Pelagihabitans pacificus]NHF59275.1 tetratricopeptide repeat protein [Pelagihabitans pacificus]